MTVTQRRQRAQNVTKTETEKIPRRRDKVKLWCNVQDEIHSVLKQRQEKGATAANNVQVC